MNKKFKLMWENNPDTPIDASSLSKFVDSYSEKGGILYNDIPELIPNGTYSDGRLKLRTNSKIIMKSPQTRAIFFTLNDSVVSHNSQFGSITPDNVVFLKDSLDESMSAYIGEGTTNMFSNPGFENGLNDWIVPLEQDQGNPPPGYNDIIWGSEYGAKVEVITPGFESNNCLYMFNGAFGATQISRTFDLTGYTRVSLSFYYKSEGNLNILIKSGSLYWKNGMWNPTSSYYYTLPSTEGEWKRYEIKNITTASIAAFAYIVEMTIYSDNQYAENYIDSFQLEDHDFASPYVDGIRTDALLKYTSNIININKGLIDIAVFPKNKADFTIFSAESNLPENAIELNYIEASDEFRFRIYDIVEEDYIEIISAARLNERIDNWMRIICSWNKDEGLKIITTSAPTIQAKLTTFTPMEISRIQNFAIASNRENEIFNGYIDGFKINVTSKKDVDIYKDFQATTVSVDKDIFKMFEVKEEAIIIDASMLDTGAEFQINTDYFLWIVDDYNQDTGSVVISTSENSPIDILPEDARLFAGFKTDQAAMPIMSSLWDTTTKEDVRINTERFIVAGTNTDVYNFDIRTIPYAEENDIRSTIPIHFSDNLYGRHITDNVTNTVSGSHNVQYFEVNTEGWLGLDNIKIDGNTISTRNYVEGSGNIYSNDLELTVYDINEATRVWIHASEIDIDSGNSDIKLDSLRIDENILYSKDFTDLYINANYVATTHSNDIYMIARDIHIEPTNDLAFNVNADFIVTAGRHITLTSTTGIITLDDLHIDNHHLYNQTDIHIYSEDDNVDIDSGTSGTIQLDDIIIKDNYIYRDTGDIHIETPDSIYIGKDGEDADNVYIRSENFIVESNNVMFTNVDLGDFIVFDNIKIRQNEVYTTGATSLRLRSESNIALQTENIIEFEDSAVALFISKIESTFTKDLNVKNVIFTDTEIADTISLFTATTGGVSTLHMRTNQLNDEIIIENGTDGTLIINQNGLTINGNLTVTGTQSTVNSVNTDIADSTFTIKTAASPIDGDASYEVQRAVNNAKLLWNESEDYWKLDMGDGIQHNIIFDGYNEQFEDNINIVTSAPAGFKLENDHAIAGIELLNPDLTNTNPGEGILNLGLHMNKAEGFIQNKLGYEAESVGAWISINTKLSERSFKWMWEDVNSSVEKEMASLKLNNQSVAQGLSTQSDLGYFKTPWIRTSAVEVYGEGGVASTGLFMGSGATTPHGYVLSDDEIVLSVNGENSFHIVPSGDVTILHELYAEKVHNAVWGDIAECWIKLNGYEFDYHQVVVRTENGVRPSNKRAEKATIGVISDTYGYLLKSDEFNPKDFKGSKSVPIALSGTVKCILSGRAKIGDEVVSYKNGKVIKANWFEHIFMRDRIIGIIDNLQNGCIVKVK